MEPQRQKEIRSMTSWAHDAQPVIRALRYIRSKGSCTTEQLVEWDSKHGKQLFTWDDSEGARLNRLQEARMFFNRFRLTIGQFRVRALINIRGADEEAPDGESRVRAYYPVEEIAERPDLRALVVADLTRRMTSIARELAMWKLTSEEQKKLFDLLHQALDGNQ